MNEQPATLSPKRPRFTEETLQEIRIADGDGETTVAAYSFTHNGQPAEKVAPLDELTAAEREAALAFILKHAPAAKIKRKKARRSRKQPRLFNEAPVEFEPVDLDSLTPPELPDMEIPEGDNG